MKNTSYILPILLLLIWKGVCFTGLISPLLLPSPESIVRTLFSTVVSSETFWRSSWFTLYRSLTSFALACFVGIPLGLFMGYNRKIYVAFEFIIDFFRSIPPIVLFPLFILILGIGEMSKLFVSFYGCVLVIIINSATGVQNSSHLRRTVGRVFGLSERHIFWKIVVPDSAIQVSAGMRTALSLSLVLTIVVEMLIGSDEGIGRMIYNYHLSYEIPEMYALIFITGLVGYGYNKLFILLQDRVLHWSDKPSNML